MKSLPVAEFATIVGGAARGIGQGASITGFALDSREVRPGDLFIAIKGERTDGHQYASKAFNLGAVAVLVEQPVEGPYVLVQNVVQSLGAYAKYQRSRFDGPVVGVTGSAGKTTTKELIAAALGRLGPVLKTEGNRNSEFSSPLIWADLTPEIKSVVVEMGMRGFGQIEYLASFTRPNIGVITNIGHSHIELVGSREGVAKAKGELMAALPADGHAVLWAEDPFLDSLRSLSKAPVRTFGISDAADCRILSYKALSWRESELEGELDGVRFRAVLPAAGKHIALNAAAAILAASAAGVGPSLAAAALSSAEFPPMRMGVLDYRGATIILDAYNASPSSVIAALETLQDLPAGRRIVILGEMRELGSHTEMGHREVGGVLAQSGIDLALLYGEPTRWISAGAQSAGMAANLIRHVDSLEEIGSFLKTLGSGDVVLIKGSRVLELERALDYLKEPAC